MKARRAALALLFASSAAASAQEVFSPFVGSQPSNIERMIRLARLKPGDVVADLGSGDGRIVFAALRANPNVTGWGVDLDRKLVRESNQAARKAGLAARARFIHANVFDADVSKADVIFMWLFPELQRLLRTKILAEARPGTRIVTNLWDMGSWAPDEVDGDELSAVRAWTVPARVAGNWNWRLTFAGVPQDYAAVLEQQFQKVEGVVRYNDRRRVLHDFKLSGDQLGFSLLVDVERIGYTRHQFSGTVKGDAVEGRALIYHPTRADPEEYEYSELAWRAKREARSAYFAPTGISPR